MNIPANKVTELNKAIDRILAIVNVHRIYLSSVVPSGLVVVLRGRRQPAEVLEQLLNTQLEEIGYQVYLIQNRDVKNGMRNGSIMLFNTLNIERMLYADPASDDTIFEQSLDPREAVRRTSAFLSEEREKIDEFKAGARSYEASKNYEMATFMRHQQTELTLRAVCYLLVGWQLKSHSISKAIGFLSNHIPDFRQSINIDSEEISGLLKSLDQSYKAVRYRNDYTQTEKSYRALVHWVTEVETVVNDAIDPAMKQYVQVNQRKATLPYVDPGECTPNLARSLLDQILAMLCDALPLCALYFLAEVQQTSRRHNLFEADEKQTSETRYLMLAIAQPHPRLHSLANRAKDIINNSHLPVKIMLLCHDEDEVRKALGRGDRFFCRAVSQAKLLFGEAATFQPPSPTVSDPRADEVSAIYWEQRYRRAATLSEAARAQGRVGFADTQIQLLYLAFEQLLCGLVHRCMGYRVKGGSLSSHLALTEYMMPSSAKELDVMHQELKRLSNLYHHVSHGPLALYDGHEVAGWQRKLEAALKRFSDD